MKQKLKNTQRGITLVALVITIIVLLILAMVSIKIAIDGGLIQKVKTATDTHTIGAEKEKITLGYNEYTLAKASGKTVTAPTVEGASVTGNETAGWTITFAHSDGDHVYTLSSDGTIKEQTNSSSTTAITWTKTDEGITSSTGVIVQIGDYVNYDEGTSGTTEVTTAESGYSSVQKVTTVEDLDWRVLGVNSSGELELISADPTTALLYLEGETGYLNAETTLDDYCDELYGKGANASGARSLKVEDVDTLANYDKTTYSGYGVEWQWRYPTQEEADKENGTANSTRYIQYSKNGTDWTNITSSSSFQQFKYPGEAVINSSNPGTRAVKNTYYLYPAKIKIANNMSTDIANMITKGTTSSHINQWLSSRCVDCSTDYAAFSVRSLHNGYVYDSYYRLFISYVTSSCASHRVRPVVTLRSSISLDAGSNTSHTTSATAWTING